MGVLLSMTVMKISDIPIPSRVFFSTISKTLFIDIRVELYVNDHRGLEFFEIFSFPFTVWEL